jgi:DNA-binding NarL/FixJ family response regulator
MIRIAVDDHPVFHGGIVALAGHQSDMSVVGEASNGHEANMPPTML